MKKYQVLLEGKNILLDRDGKLVKHGFFTTRFVEANNPEEAEVAAVALIKDDSTLTESVRNGHSSEPIIYVEELSEIESFEDISVPGAGYSFYIDKKPWWKAW